MFGPGDTANFVNSNVGEKQYPNGVVEVLTGPDSAGTQKVRYTDRRNPADTDWCAYRGELR